MSCRRRHGFTLIEILLVIVIFSILAGLAAPNISNFSGKLVLKSTAYEILDLMQSAQSRAISQNGEFRLISSTDRSYLWLEKKDGSGYARLSGRLGKVIHILPDIHVASEEIPVEFFPDGSIGETEISVCSRSDCFLISTKEQYADIRISEWTPE